MATKATESVEVRLWAALSRGVAPGQQALGAALHTGDWRQAATTWMRVARDLADTAGAPVGLGDLCEELTAKLISEDVLDDNVRAILAELTGGLRWKSRLASLGGLAEWLARRAQPGDAAVVVAVVGSSWLNDPDLDANEGRPLPLALMPLVRWLLRSGAAELRMQGRAVDTTGVIDGTSARSSQHLRGADLLLRLATSIEAHGPDELLPVAISYVVSAQHIDPVHPIDVSRLWRLAEAGLARGMSGAVALDALRLARGHRPAPLGVRWLPLTADGLPLCAGELVDALAHDRLPNDAFREGIGFALVRDEVVAVAANVACDVLHRAIEAAAEIRTIERSAAHAAAHGLPLPVAETALDPQRARVCLSTWVRAAAQAVAPHLRGAHADAMVLRDLDVLCRRGFSEVICAGLVACGGARAALTKLSQEAPASSALVHAMTAVLRTNAAPELSATDLGGFARELERVIHHPWMSTVAGVDMRALLDDVLRVEVVDLPDNRAVEIAGEVLRVDGRYPRQAFTSYPHERAMMSSLLYVAHELVHVAQGFAGMTTVAHARAVGAETTIMQVDLAADHIAARIVGEVFGPTWSLASLKDETGRGLVAFPVGRFHTEASRQRKAVRLATSRFDLAARSFWNDGAHRDAFFMLDFAPGGSSCLVFVSAAQLRLVCPPLVLEGADREVLLTSADGDVPFEEVMERVDAVVRRLAEQAWTSRFRLP